MARLKQGQSPAPGQWTKIEGILLKNQGSTGEQLKSLISEQVGLEVTVNTVYRWMKRLGVSTARQTARMRPVAHGEERGQIKRLLEQMIVPPIEEIKASWRFASRGVSVINLPASGRSFRVISSDGRSVESCWFSQGELELLNGVLERADRNRGTRLVERLDQLVRATTTAVGRALSLQQSLNRDGEWRTRNVRSSTPRQQEGDELSSELLDLASDALEFKSDVLVVIGA